jgi:hypothetical protein
MPVEDFFIKVGDRRPFIYAVLTDANGPVSLLGSTVAFHMRLAGQTAVVKVNAAAVVDVAVDAEVHYEWALADTDTGGIYEAEFEATLPDGRKVTFPNWRHLIVKVSDDVD